MSADRSEKALLARLETAKKATPGPWEPDYRGQYVFGLPPDEIMVAEMRGIGDGLDAKQRAANAAHIAASNPDVVIADIGEILWLRAALARLEKEADWLAEKLARRDCPSQCERYELVAGLPCVCADKPCEGGDTASCWRKVAHKAVEKSEEE